MAGMSSQTVAPKSPAPGAQGRASAGAENKGPRKVIELFVDRAKPTLPYVVPDADIIVAGVRIEPASFGEEPGWSDWTKKNSLFYKFKYTVPKARDPVRVVFLVPKTREISIYEFAEKIEKTAFFHAVIKWARFPEYHKIESEFEDPGEIVYRLVRTLEPEEITILERELAKKGINLYIFFLEMLINSRNPLKTTIEKIYNPLEGRYKLALIYEEKLEFNDYYHVLPFTITITIRRELDHMLVPLNYALQAICSVLKPEIKCKNSTNIERYVDLVEIFNNLINYAEDKLRDDYMKRIDAIIKYYYISS